MKKFALISSIVLMALASGCAYEREGQHDPCDSAHASYDACFDNADGFDASTYTNSDGDPGVQFDEQDVGAGSWPYSLGVFCTADDPQADCAGQTFEVGDDAAPVDTWVSQQTEFIYGTAGQVTFGEAQTRGGEVVMSVKVNNLELTDGNKRVYFKTAEYNP